PASAAPCEGGGGGHRRTARWWSGGRGRRGATRGGGRSRGEWAKLTRRLVRTPDPSRRPCSLPGRGQTRAGPVRRRRDLRGGRSPGRGRPHRGGVAGGDRPRHRLGGGPQRRRRRPGGSVTIERPLSPEATLDYCIKCNICVTACPVSAVTDLFPGPKY